MTTETEFREKLWANLGARRTDELTRTNFRLGSRDQPARLLTPNLLARKGGGIRPWSNAARTFGEEGLRAVEFDRFVRSL